MKLIIDIPEWYYNEVKEFKHPVLIDKSIMNGTPFDSVIEEERKKYNDIALDLLGEVEHYEKAIEDIKAEINRKANSGQWSDATVYGMKKALAIIDKHMRGDK